MLAACQTAPWTPTPTRLVSLTATFRSTPAQTSISKTATPEAKPTRTHTPATPTPSQSALEIVSAVLTELEIEKERIYSPDGRCEWEKLQAFPVDNLALKYEWKFFVYVRVACYGGMEKKFELVKQWSEMGLGYALPKLLGWSADGSYLYFYDSIIPDGCQPLGGYQQNLRKVNLLTGEFQTLPPGWMEGLTLAPDARRVAYSVLKKAEVGLYDLILDDEKRIPYELPEAVENWSGGNFIWSPDGENVLFLLQYDDPCFPTGFSIRRLDLRVETIYNLMDIEAQSFRLIEWSEPERVQVVVDGEQKWLDPLRGEWILP